jgi:hypothetical protein
MTQSEADNKPQKADSKASQPRSGAGDQGRPRRRTRRKKKKKSRGQHAARQRVASDIDPVVAAFGGCGRCSFFLSGYRARRGVEPFLADVRQMEDDWLTLTWQNDMADLIKKSYGFEMSDGLFHLEHCCRECQRTIIYDNSAEDADALPVVQAQLKPE